MKKWTLICVEGDSWQEVVSSVREWAKEIAIASSAPVPREPPPWILSGKGMMWAGIGNRPNLDKLSALANPTNATPVRSPANSSESNTPPQVGSAPAEEYNNRNQRPLPNRTDGTSLTPDPESGT